MGEFYALRSVEVGHGTEQAFGSVLAALAAGFVAVAALGLLESRQASEDD